MRPGRCQPSRNLGPAWLEARSWQEAESYTGRRASPGSSLWDTDPVQHCAWALHSYLEPESSTPHVLKESTAADGGDSETQERTFQRGWRSVCVAGLSSKRDR